MHHIWSFYNIFEFFDLIYQLLFFLLRSNILGELLPFQSAIFSQGIWSFWIGFAGGLAGLPLWSIAWRVCSFISGFGFVFQHFTCVLSNLLVVYLRDKVFNKAIIIFIRHEEVAIVAELAEIVMS